MIRYLIYFLFLFSKISIGQLNDTLSKKSFTKKSTILSSLIPGAGQVHNNSIRPQEIRNKLWWKLPIIYGGIGATCIQINLNNQEFNNVKNERISRVNGNPPLNYTSYSNDQLKLIQDQYRRLRDLSIISFLGVYLIQIIDANVEAHLFLFDISDNLGFQFKPYYQPGYQSNYFIPQLSINVKI
tara:strand:- start:104 stop:655 length:552 start_codon:yes stop_codon:yes gene_type:complete